MPIYNMEYRSEDEEKAAVIRNLKDRWTISKWRGKRETTHLVGIYNTKTLIGAQAIARKWVG